MLGLSPGEFGHEPFDHACRRGQRGINLRPDCFGQVLLFDDRGERGVNAQIIAAQRGGDSDQTGVDLSLGLTDTDFSDAREFGIEVIGWFGLLF